MIAQLLVGGEEMVGKADRSAETSVLVAALATLKDACRNHERNRDAFISTNMAQVCLCAAQSGHGVYEMKTLLNGRRMYIYRAIVYPFNCSPFRELQPLRL